MQSNALRPIVTGRLLLTPVERENLRLLWQIMRSPDLREYQDIPRVPFERFHERLTNRSAALTRGALGRFEWLIGLRDDVETIGWVSVRFQRNHRNRGELGYSILTPWRRAGFAAEAVGALTAHVFEEDVVETVEAFCMPENAGSRGVLRRVGLEERETLRRGAIVAGRPVDVLRFEVTRKQWLSRGRQIRPQGASH